MSTDRIEVHAAPDGSAYGDGSRGYPVRDVHAALRLARQRRALGQRVVVWLAPGTYAQSETLELAPADSFTTFAAATDAPTVLEGAVRLTGWRPVTVNGADVLATPSPVARARALYVGERRVPRPRWPREGFLRVAGQEGLDPRGGFVSTLFDGSDRFRFTEGDLPPLAEPRQVEVVVPHYWVQERMPVAEVDHERREVRSTLRSIFALRDDAEERFARYWLDNVGEAFGQVPGQWYLDTTGLLSGLAGPQVLYAPRPGEDMDALEVRLPVLDVFVRLAGTGADPVREVRWEGLTFAWADFDEVPAARAPFGVREDPVLPVDVGFAADVQAASTVPAALALDGARSCALVDCVVSHVGGYGLSLGPGSRGNLVSGCRFVDLGAGAVRSGGSADAASSEFNRANEVSDTVVSGGGRVYPSCAGVLLQHGSHNVVAHNHLHDLRYTAVSVGWTWDYGASPSQGNLVVGNHIHDLGQGLLNDMGGVYLLGIAPGTVVRGNHIHDVTCANYGGWGIYLDEGSSHVVVEGNVVHDVSSQAYHHHYGREVIVRHNVLAFGGQGQVSITRPEEHVSFTLERNVLLGRSRPGYAGSPGVRDLRRYAVVSDLNLFFDLEPVTGAVRAGTGTGRPVWQLVEGMDGAWADLGHDRHSTDADPGFADLASWDLRVPEDSPVHALGIRVPDVSTAGPRPAAQRLHPLAARTRPDQFAPSRG